MTVVRRCALTCAALGAALLTTVGAADVSASTAIRPAPGTPDPKEMVLTSADLRSARVTRQRYYKDADFPSVISYEREFEDARSGATPLLVVISEAEIGVSVRSTAEFVRTIKLLGSTKEGRALLTALIEAEFGGDESIASIKVGRARVLGVGTDSVDIPMTLEVLGIRTDLHFASFRVEHVLGNLVVLGVPGRRVSASVITRLARTMGARIQTQLAPKNTALPAISGTPVAGETLATTPGTWSGSLTGFAYQWGRCNPAGAGCTTIPGATGRTYVVAVADLGSTLRVSVWPRGASTRTAVASAPTGVVAGFVDTFSAAQVSSFWSLGTTGTGPTVAQANGRLEVTLRPGTMLAPGGFANAFASMTCRLPGDFEMQVDYQLVSGLLPVDGIHVGFDAAEFTGTTRSGEHGMYVQNAGGNNHGISTHFPGPNSFVSDASSSGTLRLVRSTTGGVTTTTASRGTGSSWSFTSAPYSAPTSQAANLDVFTNVTPFPTEIRVAYDNFRITSGAITCP